MTVLVILEAITQLLRRVWRVVLMINRANGQELYSTCCNILEQIRGKGVQ